MCESDHYAVYLNAACRSQHDKTGKILYWIHVTENVFYVKSQKSVVRTPGLKIPLDSAQTPQKPLGSTCFSWANGGAYSGEPGHPGPGFVPSLQPRFPPLVK